MTRINRKARNAMSYVNAVSAAMSILDLAFLPQFGAAKNKQFCFSPRSRRTPRRCRDNDNIKKCSPEYIGERTNDLNASFQT